MGEIVSYEHLHTQSHWFFNDWLYIIWEASRKKVPYAVSRCHTKRRMGTQLSKNIICDVSRVKLWKIGFIPKEGMTLTQGIRDLFAWRHPFVLLDLIQMLTCCQELTSIFTMTSTKHSLLQIVAQTDHSGKCRSLHKVQLLGPSHKASFKGHLFWPS